MHNLQNENLSSHTAECEISSKHTKWRY